MNLFPPAPPPLDRFVPVYLAMPDPREAQDYTGPTVIPIIMGDMQLSREEYKCDCLNFFCNRKALFRFPSTVTLVRDGVRCNLLVDTGLALYKNTVRGGIFT